MGTGSQVFDIAVVGAGAAGLMAGIQAGRAGLAHGRRLRIVVLDGAVRPGAKILVSGGGRCNVTHDVVEAEEFAGSSAKSIRKVLLQFDVASTVGFFHELGVELKEEGTGKLFPVTDRAGTVLDGLLEAARRAHVQLLHPWRVEGILLQDEGFVIKRGSASHGRNRIPSDPSPLAGHSDKDTHGTSTLRATRVILATGGRSLPKSGSDGQGYRLAESLGHSITPQVFPALVPLVLEAGHFLRGLSGITFPAGVEVRSATGKRLRRFEDSTLCTHFGLSGPSIMDVSRYFLAARFHDPQARLVMDFLPGRKPEDLDRDLRELGAVPVVRYLSRELPERLARELCAAVQLRPDTPGSELPRASRRTLVSALHEYPLPIAGDRGFTYAEVTAGGVPLSEVRLETMESRFAEGLHLCGEICDVDGRIGGFNFQWAWASGTVAGRGAASRLKPGGTGRV